jgi:Flp pilus assembly protein TadD
MQIGFSHLLITGIVLTSLPIASVASAQTADRSASEYRQQGLRDRQQGNLTAAIAALQKSVELDPTNLSGQVALGWTFHLAGQAEEAAQTLRQALQQDPTHVPALNALGIVYLVNDDWVAAATTHTWAILLSPDNEIAYYNLSLACERMKQYDWAIATAQKAAILEPDNPHPLVALAIAQAAHGEMAIAQQTYQQAIDLDGRYRSSAFLNGLEAAGFSPEQIAASQQLLNTLP